MPEHDKSEFEAADFTVALGLLSRLPVRVNPENRRGAEAAWAYPLAGAFLGLLVALAGQIALWLGLPEMLAATAVLATQAMLTGAMHEDGLADSADGLWGGWDRERRLEIMKDSRTGAYGVIALVLALLARWAALVALLQAGVLFWTLIATAALSRVPMVLMMAVMHNSRGTGLSATVGQVSRRGAGVASMLALAIALVCIGWPGLEGALWGGLAALGLALIAQRKIGGQTGDILGASQQLAEIAILAALATELT